MSDPAQKETDRLIAEMEKRIAAEYKQAEKEIAAKLKDYMRRFETKDRIWQKWVADGKETKEAYMKWRLGQVMVGKRWEEMRNTLAQDFQNANRIAGSIVNGYRPEVYALNHDYATFQVEKDGLVDTSYSLYDRPTAERLFRDNPQMLPPPGKQVSQEIREGKAVRWNQQQIQSVMMQSLLQGESIPDIATRLANAVGDSNRKAAVRNARTMATGAQNAGRVDAYKRAEDMGVKLEQEWIATLDMRTRHEHRMLDGERAKVGDYFVVPDTGDKIRFPGDPEADPHMVYNCFVGDTDIATDSSIIRSYKHEYSGELISVKTASGVYFTCTPNHPILTPGGWVPAALLNNGDNLLVARVGNCGGIRRKGNIEHIHSGLHTLYYALHGFGLMSRDSALRINFHGDIPTTNVEVITKEWKLRGDWDSGRDESVDKILFKNTNKTLVGKRSFMKHFRAIWSPTFCGVSGAGKALALLCGCVGHSIIHSLRAISWRNATILEAKANDMASDAKFGSNSLDGTPGEVFADDIVDIKIKSVSHIPIFNLQTDNGYYFVNSIIPQSAGKYNGNYAVAHNCRCTLRGAVDGWESKAKGLRSMKDLEGMTYEEWKQSKKVKTNPILLPEEKAEAIRGSYIARYKKK